MRRGNIGKQKSGRAKKKNSSSRIKRYGDGRQWETMSSFVLRGNALMDATSRDATAVCASGQL